MDHYDAHGDSDWACGGDEDCESVESMPDCTDGLRHDWTSQGCGGCDSNPGVWSLGGTTIQSERRCRVCGCAEHRVHHGSQRNPGECDERQYEPGAYEPEEDAVKRAQRLERNRACARKRRRGVGGEVVS